MGTTPAGGVGDHIVKKRGGNRTPPSELLPLGDVTVPLLGSTSPLILQSSALIILRFALVVNPLQWTVWGVA